MSYDCYCDDYDVSTELYSARTQGARKEYRCGECSGRIQAGEPYEYVFAIWDGDRYVCRTCERCLDLRQWTTNNVPCVCWHHGSMIDDCSYAIWSGWERAKDETRGLRFGFLRRLHAIKRRAA